MLADADLERAANGIAWGGLFNSGQVCVSVERVYVEAPVYDEFVVPARQKVNGLRRARTTAVATTSAQWPPSAARHRRAPRRRRGGGGRAGAHRRQGDGVGTFFEPTVLVDVDHSMACMTEETFGPTLPVMKVADVDEAVRLANDSPYGLSATVWTADLERGERIARRLDAGAVNINDALSNVFSYAVPMGGWKNSGVGARSAELPGCSNTAAHRRSRRRACRRRRRS